MNPLRRIEQEVLALGREWTRLELQKRLQEQCDELPMECPQTGQPLENTRWREMELDTVSGKVCMAPELPNPRNGSKKSCIACDTARRPESFASWSNCWSPKRSVQSNIGNSSLEK